LRSSPDAIAGAYRALKAQRAHASAGVFAPLLGPRTAVLTAMNGIPWWYFYRQRGGLEGHHLESVDPGAAQWNAIGPERAIGCVVDPACEVVAPRVIEHRLFKRFTVGEPDGCGSDVRYNARMRIAAVSDIHGNLNALDAVLADIERRGVDRIVNLGDIVSGPLMPRETARRLMALGLPTIRGNHERQVLTLDPARMGPSDRYAFDALGEDERRWMAALPSVLSLEGDVFLCHATPANDVDCYLEDLDEGELRPAPLRRIEARTVGVDASLILCGHSHIPKLVRLRSGQTIVNPGSVGIQAYEGHDPGPHRVEIGAPHARYAVAVEFFAVVYDWESAARLAEQRERPDWVRALRTGFVTH
jgi:putative phosphoesterase